MIDTAKLHRISFNKINLQLFKRQVDTFNAENVAKVTQAGSSCLQ